MFILNEKAWKYGTVIFVTPTSVAMEEAYLHLTFKFEFFHRVVSDIVEIIVLNSQKDNFKIIEPNFIIIFSIVIILIVLDYFAI